LATTHCAGPIRGKRPGTCGCKGPFLTQHAGQGQPPLVGVGHVHRKSTGRFFPGVIRAPYVQRKTAGDLKRWCLKTHQKKLFAKTHARLCLKNDSGHPLKLTSLTYPRKETGLDLLPNKAPRDHSFSPGEY